MEINRASDKSNQYDKEREREREKSNKSGGKALKNKNSLPPIRNDCGILFVRGVDEIKKRLTECKGEQFQINGSILCKGNHRN